MENMENLDFQYFFNEKIKERGLNLKKLSEMSGIALKHLENLSRGDFSRLPSEPYFRGYLIKLGQVLGFDPQEWWIKFRAGGFVKNSGANDLLAKNLRRSKKPSRRTAALLAILAIFLLYIGLRFSKIFGKPEITITSPAQNPATVGMSKINLSGTAKNASNLYINGEAVTLSEDGSWSKTVLLQSGVNSLEVRAEKFLGGEAKIVEQIIYQPSATSAAPFGQNP
jgi:hypothetical protein